MKEELKKSLQKHNVKEHTMKQNTASFKLVETFSLYNSQQLQDVVCWQTH